MAYATGTANSFSDLLTALRNACTSNGWTLSGEVLHKGTCYVQTRVGENGQTVDSPPSNSMLIIRAGTGIDGSNLLTGASTVTLGGPRIGRLQAASGSTFPDWDWPVTYHCHINTAPDEVCFVVNYGAGQYFQMLMFGQSPSSGNAGTGNWHFGTIPEFGTYTALTRRVNEAGVTPNATQMAPAGMFCPMIAWLQGNGAYSMQTDKCNNFQIHGAIIDSTGLPDWSNKYYSLDIFNPPTYDLVVCAGITIMPLMSYQPNAWNNESLLLPIQICQPRSSGKMSLIGELGSIRAIRNDFISDGEIITLGSDSWKVYPAYKKNAAVRNGATSGLDHSGTMAMAIRYDGP